jgi:hypothetical protein
MENRYIANIKDNKINEIIVVDQKFKPKENQIDITDIKSKVRKGFPVKDKKVLFPNNIYEEWNGEKYIITDKTKKAIKERVILSIKSLGKKAEEKPFKYIDGNEYSAKQKDLFEMFLYIFFYKNMDRQTNIHWYDNNDDVVVLTINTLHSIKDNILKRNSEIKELVYNEVKKAKKLTTEELINFKYPEF